MVKLMTIKERFFQEARRTFFLAIEKNKEEVLVKKVKKIKV